MNNENPYHSITLPSPPAGYRLAKWGEEWTTRDAMWMDVNKWVAWDVGSKLVKWHKDKPAFSIFAIPLDQPSPLKSWQFREVPWVVPQPKTLADVPDKIDVIAGLKGGSGACYVMFRDGDTAFYRKCNGTVGETLSASEWKFVRYLDPPPQKPLSLDDVPDGRVILCDGDYYWRSGQWYRQSPKTGAIYFQSYPRQDFTVTDHIAEFK